MDTNAWWYVNGRWTHPQDATISINDVAFLRGYCAFESLRTYDHRPFHLNEHLLRLYHSADIIELEIPYTRDFIASIVRQTIERNVYRHAALRIFITGGLSEDGVLPSGSPMLAVLITQLAERDMETLARGVTLSTTHLQRVSPEAKTSNYVSALIALKHAAREGASDALFVNEHEQVLEGTKSNLFIFRGDTLITPRTGVLLGITRDLVLELAQGRFNIEERPIQMDELSQVDEAFITSSSKEIVPVIQIDDIQIGPGRPGPRTYELEQRFIALVERGDF